MTPKQKKIKEINDKYKEYYKDYYSSEKGDKNRERARRTIIMRQEAGVFKEYMKAWAKKKKDKVKNTKRTMTIDGVEVYKWGYAFRYMLNYLSYNGAMEAHKKGIIPKPIYMRKTATGRPRYYLSRRQITMINRCWNKRKNSKTVKSMKERREYLHANWTKGEVGFRNKG